MRPDGFGGGAQPARQIADIAAALRDEQISVEAMLQRGRSPDEPAPVVITTLDAVLEPPRRIRIEAL